MSILGFALLSIGFFLIPAFLVASASMDIKKRSMRFVLSMFFWPLVVIAITVYFGVLSPPPDAVKIERTPASLFLALAYPFFAALAASSLATWLFNRRGRIHPQA